MVYIVRKPLLLILQDNTLSYFISLIGLDAKENINLRLFVHKPFIKEAQINLIYCYDGEDVINDVKIKIANFILYIEKDSLFCLSNADISFENNILVIKAPNIRGKNFLNNISFKKKISIVLEKEVNPILFLHGGFVRLIDVIKNHTLLLEFGGSCTGCGLLSITLEKTIKKIVKRNFPKIKKILDYSKVTNK